MSDRQPSDVGRWVDTKGNDLEGVQTHARLAVEATPQAAEHMARSLMSRRALAHTGTAALDPEGDARRVIAYVIANTPAAVLRPGELARHCGITRRRASGVLDALAADGWLAESATDTRVSVVGERLLAEVGEVGCLP